MSQSVIAYHNLKISPYDLANIQDVTITKMINEHAVLKFSGIVPEHMKDSYVSMTGPDTQVQVSQVDEDGGSKPLFAGLVQKIEIHSVRDVYHIVVEAISHTYQLDVKRESRSFQNKGMAYSSLINKITADYPGIDVIDTASKGASIGNFTIQYEETDWEFLKRMASRFSTGLVPASSFDEPKFFFGIPDGSSKGKLEDFHYTIHKRISRYRDRTKHRVQGIDENDFIYYEVETDKVMDIGHSVDFQGKRLYIAEVHTQMSNGLLKHKYSLCTKKGMVQNKIFLMSIVGASIQGKIIDVSKDNVRIHLDIDPVQNKGEAHWFPYSSVYTAEGNSGWYCMPELGDYVRVYFPSHKEEDGVASSSVRKDNNEGTNNKMGNPDVKMLRTAAGKELMFGPSEIMLSAKDGETFIKLSDNGGIEIISNKEIKLTAKENITMSSEKKVVITAADEIQMTCKESNIKMDGNVIITGNEVKTN